LRRTLGMPPTSSVIGSVGRRTSRITNTEAIGEKYHPRSETASCRHINAAIALLPPLVQALHLTAKTVDGADFSGQSLAGKPAVLWFWGTGGLKPSPRPERGQ
jgi:hypothetical protein